MSSDPPRNASDDMEARLIALLLGELPGEDAVALRRALEHDAGLSANYDLLKRTIELVRQTAASPAELSATRPAPLKLDDQRRHRLFVHFKTVAPKEFTAPRRRGMPWVIPISIAAVLVVLLGVGVLAPVSLRARKFTQLYATQNRLELTEDAKDQWENRKDAGNTPRPEGLAPYFKGAGLPKSAAGEAFQ